MVGVSRIRVHNQDLHPQATTQRKPTTVEQERKRSKFLLSSCLWVLSPYTHILHYTSPRDDGEGLGGYACRG